MIAVERKPRRRHAGQTTRTCRAGVRRPLVEHAPDGRDAYPVCFRDLLAGIAGYEEAETEVLPLADFPRRVFCAKRFSARLEVGQGSPVTL
jgi:hypothetical protein